MAEEWEPFERLGDRIKETLNSLGLDFLTWAILPGKDRLDGKSCQIIAEIRPDAFLPEGQRDTDEAFDKFAREERRLALAEETAQITRDLLKPGEHGIFAPSDDDTPKE